MMVLRNFSLETDLSWRVALSKVLSLPQGISSNLVTGWGRRIKAGLLASRGVTPKGQPSPEVPALQSSSTPPSARCCSFHSPDADLDGTHRPLPQSFLPINLCLTVYFSEILTHDNY